MVNWFLFLLITFFVIIGEFSKDILTVVLRFFYKKSHLVIDIEKEITEIKNKMDSISMVDEFAKYAKLERKLNTLKGQLKTESKEGEVFYISMKYIVSMAVQLLWTSISSYLIWNNLNTPLLSMDPSWLTPLNTWIAWPSQTPGDVGVLPWFLVVKNVAKNVHLLK